MNEILIQGTDLIIIAILVLGLGSFLTGKISFLRKYSIPVSVTGGLICSIAVAVIAGMGGPKFTFAMEIRDTLLLVFFSTIGISAKFSRLKSGGKTLGILVVCAGVFLILQDITGVALAWAFGAHPGLGLFAGSVSLAGGHGTAIAWGKEAAAAGLENAELVGIAFATFGLVVGGIIGGPIAERLIAKNGLTSDEDDTSTQAGGGSPGEKPLEPFTLQRTLRILMILALCVSLGEVINRWLFHNDIKLPGFLTAMLVGIVLTNLTDKIKRPLNVRDFDKVGEVALQLFLAMSLMSMDLTSLAGAFGYIFLVLCVQVLVITVFAVHVIFRLMGRTYDAAVIAGGFCGLGMGATPVAIANMNAITAKHGPSFKAFLVIPLVGAFFIDLLNAVIIKFFLGLPMMQLVPTAGG